VHIDASYIALGTVLSQPGEGDINHPIAFASRKLSTFENNYTTTQQEGVPWSMHYRISGTTYWGPTSRCIQTIIP
jgi:hypothetical protein